MQPSMDQDMPGGESPSAPLRPARMDGWDAAGPLRGVFALGRMLVARLPYRAECRGVLADLPSLLHCHGDSPVELRNAVLRPSHGRTV